MSDEALKVSLVRCPKCQNLLSEPSDHSLYQCGGCGTVLQANKKLVVNDEVSEKIEDEKVIEDTGNLESIAGQSTVSNVDVPDIEVGNNGIDHGVKERFVDSNVTSSPITQNREVYRDVDRTRGRKTVDPRFAQTSDDNIIGHENRRGRLLNQQVDNWVHGDGYNANMDKSYYSLRDEKEEIMHPNRLGMDRDGRDEFYGNSNYGAERVRPSPYVYPNEGQFNYDEGYGNDYMDGPQKIADSDYNRAEIRRKLDELKYRLSESYDNSKGKVHVDQRMTPRDDSYMSPPSTRGDNITRSPYFNRNNGHGPFINKHDIDMWNYYSRPRYAPNDIMHYEDPFRPQMLQKPTQPSSYHYQSQSSYRNISRGYLNTSHDLHDSYSHHPSCSCIQCSYRNKQVPPHSPGTYSETRRFHEDSTLPGVYHDHDVNPRNVGPRYNPKGMNSFQPHAQYPHPHERNQSDLDSEFGGLSQYRPRKSVISPHTQYPHPQERNQSDLDSEFGGLSQYRPRKSVISPHAQYPHPHERNQSDLDSEFGGLSQYRPRKSVISHLSKRLCRPVAGGAPFLACHSCLNLLKVPRKIMQKEKNNRKLQCGSCATIILFLAENEGFIVSNATPNEQINAEITNGSNEVLNENLQDSPHKFQFMDNEAKLPSNDRRLDVSDSKNRQGLHYSPKEKESPYNVIVQNDISSPGRSLNDQTMNIGNSENKQVHYSSAISPEEKESPNSAILQNDVSNLAELSLNDNMPPSSLPVPRVNEILSNHVLNRFENGNRSNRTIKDVVASEIEDSLNGYSSTGVSQDYSYEVSKEDRSPKKGFSGVSQDSSDVSKEDHLPKNNKGSRSFFTKLIKNSFRDFSRSSANMDTPKITSYVLINGRPIPPSIVEKAEMLAGTIQPGEYWYDFQAGFWGVMGQSCSGIIPPFIEEFNYPMPKNCGAGNTGVHVNGRELHQRDLDLLACRGLPTTKNKYYSVEISGKIIDEESGEELNSLGKLAPTVERTRKGFGMRAPQTGV